MRRDLLLVGAAACAWRGARAAGREKDPPIRLDEYAALTYEGVFAPRQGGVLPELEGREAEARAALGLSDRDLRRAKWRGDAALLNFVNVTVDEFERRMSDRRDALRGATTYPKPAEELQDQRRAEEVLQFCDAWAAKGECIRNPQYMYASCASACDAQTYKDVGDGCAAWAASGECEKNPGFMISQCNASCLLAARETVEAAVDAARAGGDVRENPHLREYGLKDKYEKTKDKPISRFMTFAPIFVGVALLLGGGITLAHVYARQLADAHSRVDEWLSRKAIAFQRRFPAAAPHMRRVTTTSVGRLLICAYFLNEGVSVVQTSPRLSSMFGGVVGSDGLWKDHSGAIHSPRFTRDRADVTLAIAPQASAGSTSRTSPAPSAACAAPCRSAHSPLPR